VSPPDGPLVSIGMPVYNGEAYLRAALDALLAQDWPHFELIVSDNASTDATAAVVAEYAARDGRIRYSRNAENLGAVANSQLVVDRARGKYYLWASCHDLWAPSLLRRCVQIMETDESVVLSFPRAAEIDPDGNRIGPLRGRIDTRGLSRVARYYTVTRYITGYAVYGVFRLAALKQVLPIRRVLGPDAFLLHELSLLGSYAHVPEELFFLRRMSVARNWKRYFTNLKLTYHWWSFFVLYADLFRNYLTMIRDRARSPSEAILLGIWTVLVLLQRTVLWFAGLLVSIVFPRYYRPW